MRHEPTRPRPTRPRPGRLVLAVLGLGLALALAACGGSPDDDRVASLGGDSKDGSGGSATSTTRRDPQQAALDFAKCMRSHGIDMPDPQIDEQGRITQRMGGPGSKAPDPKKLEAAQKACGAPGGGDGPAQIDPKARDAMLAYAKCMRDQGIDMPDPGADGGLELRRGEGPNPESAEFKAADKACNHHLASLGKPEAGSGGRP
jgi:hypothetical protein